MLDLPVLLAGIVIGAGLSFAATVLVRSAAKLRDIEAAITEETDRHLPACDPIPSDAQWRRMVSESRVNSPGGCA